MKNVQPPLVLGEKVWCPRCGEHVKVIRVSGAAKIVDVDRRTIYNYIKNNKVFAVKVAGSTLRVCSHCLLRENDVDHARP
jgi:hydrogenase maturation factor HypF (carbamoyltransferase family)